MDNLIRVTLTIDGVDWDALLTEDGSTLVCFDPDTCFDTSCPSLTGDLGDLVPNP